MRTSSTPAFNLFNEMDDAPHSRGKPITTKVSRKFQKEDGGTFLTGVGVEDVNLPNTKELIPYETQKVSCMISKSASSNPKSILREFPKI